jgi:hypothetical protein
MTVNTDRAKIILLLQKICVLVLYSSISFFFFFFFFNAVDDVLGMLEITASNTESAQPTTQWALQSTPVAPLDATLLDVASVKLKLLMPGFLPSTSMTALTRRQLEGSDLTIFRHTASQQLSHLHLTVSVMYSRNISENLHKETPKEETRYIAVRQLLEEVWRQQWLYRGEDSSRGCGIWDLCLPVSIRVNNTEYELGEQEALFSFSVVFLKQCGESDLEGCVGECICGR